MQHTIICDVPTRLGESPLWHPIEKVLYWVDIDDAAIYRLNISNPKLAKGQLEKIKAPEKIGSIVWRKKGGLMGAMGNQFVAIDFEKKIFLPLGSIKTNRNDIRFNDGKCDRQGRFWAGTKHIPETEFVGELFCLDKDGGITRALNDLMITNGIAWSPDNKIMYVCDSPIRKIYQASYDITTGQLNNLQLFAKIPDEQGYPDGLTVDKEGYLWSCHWDGGCITRYTPQGQVDRIIKLPVPRLTSCCFGGDHMTTLYVTSASLGLTKEELVKAPLSGQTFALEVETQGVLETAYQG